MNGRTIAGLLLGLTIPLLVAIPASADPPRPDPGAPYFGPALLYPGDTPAAYVDRVGLTPAMYTLPVPYPLDSGAVDQLEQFSALVAEQGAVLLLDVQPGPDLGELTEVDAAALARRLDVVHQRLGIRVLVRFAPEMNGTWEEWGQRPGAYVRAFRTLADEVHAVDADAEWAAMVWAPVYGSGYPFRDPDRTQGALDDVLDRDRVRLDTNGNGELDLGDDPYGPYYPGDEWVDWVGLSMYRLGQSQGARRNGVPPADELERRLQETWGYPQDNGGTSFYERFAEGRDRPMLVETAAFYNPAYEGPREIRVKRAWWTQVFGALSAYPRIAGISWLEVARAEPEALQGEPVDWRVSADPRIAAAFAEALEASSVTLGPVTEPIPLEEVETPDPGAGDAPSAEEAPDAAARPGVPLGGGDLAPWWAIGSIALLALGLLLAWAVPRWRAPPADPRDSRLDLLRGGLLLGMTGTGVGVSAAGVVDVVDPWLFTAAVGLLLLVSGAGHGIRARAVTEALDGWAGGATRIRHAVSVWAGGLGIAVLVLLLEALPGVRNPLGEYEFPDALLEYPPPSYAVWDLVSLTAAPWLVASLSLFVALAVVSPVFLVLLRRGWWWAALALSWGLYALGVATDAEVLPFGVEATLPVLVWQLPFVHGLAMGHAREGLGRFLRRGWPVALAGAFAATYAALAGRDALPAGEPPMPVVVALAAGGALALLTGAWRPLRAALGWLLEPVGRTPLLAVAVTVVGVIAVAEIAPATDSEGWLCVGGAVVLLWLLAVVAGRSRREKAA